MSGECKINMIMIITAGSYDGGACIHSETISFDSVRNADVAYEKLSVNKASKTVKIIVTKLY